MADNEVTTIDYGLADELDIETPERMKAYSHPLRRAICDVVLERAMTVTELGERFDRPRGSVAYHVDILVKAGLLRVVRTRKVRAITERFYGRTARTFKFETPVDKLPFVEELAAETDFEALQDESFFHTLAYARIPDDRRHEFEQRLADLALEFGEQPSSGDAVCALLVMTVPTTRPSPPREP